MDEIHVSSWAELQEQLFTGAWQKDILRFRSPYAFRGVPDSAYSLETSLMQLGGDYASMERHLLLNFRKYASAHSVDVDSVWYRLALAKHHGLPCRLLDWSFSPFVAMLFATANTARFDLDGAIWMVDFSMVHDAAPEKLKTLLAR